MTYYVNKNQTIESSIKMKNNNNNETVLQFFNLALEYFKKGVEAMNKGGFESTQKVNTKVTEQQKVVTKGIEQKPIKKKTTVVTNPTPATVVKKSKPTIDIVDIYNRKYLNESGTKINQKFWDDFIPCDIKEQELTYSQIIDIIKRDNISMYRWYIERCSKRRRSSYTLSQINGEIIATMVRKGIVVFDKYKTTMWKGGKGRDRGTYFGKDYLLKTTINNK